MAEVRLANEARPDLDEIKATALADTGAIPMEDVDLVVDPARQRITVNPGNPNVPLSRVKALD